MSRANHIKDFLVYISQRLAADILDNVSGLRYEYAGNRPEFELQLSNLDTIIKLLTSMFDKKLSGLVIILVT